MTWISVIDFFLCLLGLVFLFELLDAFIGLAFCKFSYRRHPKLHRLGLWFLNSSLLTYHTALPRRCQMCCGVDKCRFRDCPGQVFYRDAERSM